jgi:hypothetical protein
MRVLTLIRHSATHADGMHGDWSEYNVHDVKICNYTLENFNLPQLFVVATYFGSQVT